MLIIFLMFFSLNMGLSKMPDNKTIPSGNGFNLKYY